MCCKVAGCGGEIAHGIISLRTGCASQTPAFACEKCGRLHWANGEPVDNRQGHAAYWKDGRVLNKDKQGTVMSSI